MAVTVYSLPQRARVNSPRFPLVALAIVLTGTAVFQLDAAERRTQASDSNADAAAQSSSQPDEVSTSQGVSVLCVDGEGEPVAGAELHLFQAVPADHRYKQFGPFTSDEHGRVNCPRAVFYDGRGHFDRWAYARVSGRLVGVARSANWKNRSRVNSEFRVRLEPSRSIEGLVTVPKGYDPRDVSVHVQTLDITTGPCESLPRHLPFAGLDTALADTYDTRPDAERHFTFNDIPVRGSLCLITVAKGLAEAQWRNANNQFDTPISLKLDKEGSLSGRVLSPDGTPAGRMQVAARLSFTPQRAVFFLSTFRAVSDDHGNFTIGGLPETPFVLSVKDPNDRLTFRPMEGLAVNCGETKDATLSMETGVVVSGRVFDPEGLPVEGAAISAVTESLNGSGLAGDSTDRDGRYRLRLPTGGARLYFNSLPSGFDYPKPPIVKQLDIQAEQDPIDDLNFTIPRTDDGD